MVVTITLYTFNYIECMREEELQVQRTKAVIRGFFAATDWANE
jgi:hypothetical protein